VRPAAALTPLNDLGAGLYLNQFQGGLYPGGFNSMPAAVSLPKRPRVPIAADTKQSWEERKDRDKDRISGNATHLLSYYFKVAHLFGQSGFIFTACMWIGNRKQCNELVTPRNVIHARILGLPACFYRQNDRRVSGVAQ
jgi:hypothetical protein